MHDRDNTIFVGVYVGAAVVRSVMCILPHT